MKVVFVGSKHGSEKMPDVYKSVLSTLKKEDIEILGPVTQKYEEVLSKKEVASKSQKEIHSMFMRKVIDSADAMIVECTFDGFALGHEATIALERYKPVLALTHKDIDFSFIQDSRFFCEQYKESTDIPQILQNFINTYNKKFRALRVNFLLNQKQVNYLDWYSNKRGINKSALIRNLIDKLVSEDAEYKDKDFDKV